MLVLLPGSASIERADRSPRAWVATPDDAAAAAVLLDAFNSEFDTPTPARSSSPSDCGR